MKRYSKMVALEAKATVKVEDLQRKVIRDVKLLEKWRSVRDRARRKLETAEAEVSAGKICGWCLQANEKCTCPAEVRDAGREDA